MPIFHFHVFDGAESPDLAGTDLSDLASARKVAVQVAGELLRESGQQFWEKECWQLRVTDEHDQPLFMLDVRGIDFPA